MYSDKELLDWLASKAVGYGDGWTCRMSTTNRGVRLHETNGVPGEVVDRDPRVAIAAAMDADKNDEWPWRYGR